MTAPDDGRPDDARGLEQAVGERDLERQGTADRSVGGVRQNVDRVADKVKGLLRSAD